MRVLSREALGRWLSANGIDADRLTWRGDPAPFRLLVRDPADPDAAPGPHRRLSVPGEETIIKIPLADRPRLSRLVSRIMYEAGVGEVCAFGLPESYWLNNRGYAAYLEKVEDARRIHRFLSRAGLTNRFRGGFLVRPHEFESHLPMLAAQPFCGGPDVVFASAAPPILVTACHEFDLHVELRSAELTDRVSELARGVNLDVRRSDLPPAADDSDISAEGAKAASQPPS